MEKLCVYEEKSLVGSTPRVPGLIMNQVSWDFREKYRKNTFDAY